MCNENNNNQDSVAKKSHVTTALISEVTDISQSLVSQVLTGKRNADTTKGQTIQVAKLLLEEKIEAVIDDVRETLLIKAVKKACPFK